MGNIKFNQVKLDISTETLKILANKISDNLKDYDSIILITDAIVSNLYKEFTNQIIHKNKEEIILSDGECAKNIDNYLYIIDHLLSSNFVRNSCIVAIGGGVITDLSSFVASTYFRGIDLILVPTTLLCMVDASYGGKNGIDYKSIKNILGTIYHPNNIYINDSFLETLSKEDILSGMAEIFKMAILDQRLFKFLESSSNIISNEIIKMALDIKGKIVLKDEYDSYSRHVLNLGHTFAHAIESKSNFKIKHGIAVSYGLDLALKVSKNIGLLPINEYNRIIELKNKFNFPQTLPYSVCGIKDKIYYDKKRLDNTSIDIVLVKGIGDVIIKSITFGDLEKYL